MSIFPNFQAEDGSPLPMRPGNLAELPTRELLGVVVDSGYTGLPWEELARRLVNKAMPDLERSIRSGTIFGRCQRAERGIEHQPLLQRRPASEDIAAEAVALCLERFKADVLPAGTWDPEQGTSLEDYFTCCCLPDIANRWRWHLRRLSPGMIDLDGLDEPGQAHISLQALDPPRDPARIVELRDQITRVTASMSPDDRETFELIDQGWSPAEIARHLGINRDTLNTRISRARKTARAGRTP